MQDVEYELRERQREDPLKLVYKPYERQKEMHRSRKPLTLVVGGNRSGKSWSAVAEALLYCIGRATYAEVPEPPVTVWYIMPSLPMFRRSILPILRKLAPRDQIKPTSTGDIITKKDNIVSFHNGSELHFLSADMRQRRLQGASVDFIVIDETPDEEVFEEAQARVQDRKGRILMVFAPIDVQTWWVRDKLYLPWSAGDRRDIDVIHMPVADREGNPLVGHFTPEDIARMERQWPDPSTRAARMYGEFITRSGLVYRSFHPEIHVVQAFDIPDNYARWAICDPQYHRFMCLFFAADAEGNYYITDEYFSQDDTLARRSERISLVVGQPDRSFPMYVDSANPQDTAELNWHFQRIGANRYIGAVPLPFVKKVDDLVLRVHSLLEPSDERTYPKITGLGDCYGAPRVFLFDTLMSNWKWEERDMQCSRLIWEVQRLSWGKTGKPDKDSADGGDAADCLSYGCSIYSSGVKETSPSAWMKGLTPDDIMLWQAIDRADSATSFFARRMDL